MTSERKSETSRINGAKSRGPITQEGKARSSTNSRRHGLAAAPVLLKSESDEHFQLLLAGFMDQFQPQTALETDLVEMLAIYRWRLRRILSIEAHLFNMEILDWRNDMDADFTGLETIDHLAFAFKRLSAGNSLTILLRYEAALTRSYDKALKQLLTLRSKIPNEPTVGQAPGLPTPLPEIFPANPDYLSCTPPDPSPIPCPPKPPLSDLSS